jgi:transposase
MPAGAATADDAFRRRAGGGIGLRTAPGAVAAVSPGQAGASYWGLNPREHSSGGHQRLGSISKQGNSMLRWLLVEAAQTVARFDPELRPTHQRLKFRRASGVAKVAIARRLAVRLYWMLRGQVDHAQLVRMSGSPSSGVVPLRAESSG